MKNSIGSLIGIAFGSIVKCNYQIAFCSMVIFTMLILPNQVHRISFHLFMSSLISLISVYNFLYSSFVSLGRFIPRYFILFVAMVNGINPLISLSHFSLLQNLPQ